MDTVTLLQPEMTVEYVLKTWPSAFTIFVHGKPECIGCFLQKFCTLREVADAYEVSPEEFVEELERHVRTINNSPRS